ncbi:MAG: hypothetical protein U9O63_03215, partial [Actinomycetota bacterium]|nr:hypothetical protein [Actinomycetota bacterium]
MLRVLRRLHEELVDSVNEETDLDRLDALDVLDAVAHMKLWPPDDAPRAAQALVARIEEEVATL